MHEETIQGGSRDVPGGGRTISNPTFPESGTVVVLHKNLNIVQNQGKRYLKAHEEGPERATQLEKGVRDFL